MASSVSTSAIRSDVCTARAHEPSAFSTHSLRATATAGQNSSRHATQRWQEQEGARVHKPPAALQHARAVLVILLPLLLLPHAQGPRAFLVVSLFALPLDPDPQLPLIHRERRAASA